MSERAQSIVMPPALRPGDPVGIIAPAGAVDRTAFQSGVARLKQLGHEAIYLDSIFDRDQYFAGTVDRRVNELHEMFHRDEVKAIIAARGGYGCNYLLPFLDIESIRQNHKALIGYSDLTTLHTWFNDNGMGTFHGPMVAKDFARADGVDLASWTNLLSGSGHIIELSTARGAEIVCEGTAEGRFYGGCLSMLIESLGTPYAMDASEAILFIEDVGVWPYQVDRMLMHLRMSGRIDRVRGVVFGDMAGCKQEGLPDYSVAEIARRTLGDLGVPIVIGLRSGHVEGGNITLPMGATATLRADEQGFTLNFKGWSRQ